METKNKKKTLLSKVKKNKLIDSELIGQVYQTINYMKFSFYGGNRSVKARIVAKIEKSIKENGYYFNPILVTEAHVIVDGQHRFTACKNLGLPIQYVVVKGGLSKIKEVMDGHIILNQNASKGFDSGDWINTYAYEGNQNYRELKKFVEFYTDSKTSKPHFSINTILKIVKETPYSKRVVGTTEINGKIQKVKYRTCDFKNGELEFNNVTKYKKAADILLDYKPFTRNINNQKLVNVLLSRILKDDVYTEDAHKLMMRKLEQYSKSFSFRGNDFPLSVSEDNKNRPNAYRNLLNDIYNWRSRNRTNFWG